ncbi:MAG: hypothetical protein GC151_13325 [Betaproteobacteria bacterium]|nr:hypothetical protein [Betaproteobacteria bacterium]
MAVGPVQQIRLAALLDALQGREIEARPQQADARTDTLRPGIQVQGRVVGSLDNGRVLLDIDGSVFQARLPDGARVPEGTRLPLVVLRTVPSPVFGLAAEGAKGGPDASAHVAVSTLGAQLGAVSLAGARANRESASSLPPVAAAPPAAGDELVQPLRATVEQSGLFYESHQLEWVEGRRELSTLMTEPQARLGESSARSTAGAGDGAQPVPRHPQDGQRADATASMSRGDVAASHAPDQSGISPSLATLVDRQLQVLGTNAIHWQGQIWPGQEMAWEIGPDDDGKEGDSDPRRWSSRIRLTLPNIGELEVALRLDGERLHVDLALPASRVESVRTAVPELRGALAARGLELSGVRVNAHEER